jgi:hypothetical protein
MSARVDVSRVDIAGVDRWVTERIWLATLFPHTSWFGCPNLSFIKLQIPYKDISPCDLPFLFPSQIIYTHIHQLSAFSRYTYIFSNTLSPQFYTLVSVFKSSFSAVSELKAHPVEDLLKWSEMQPRSHYSPGIHNRDTKMRRIVTWERRHRWRPR